MCRFALYLGDEITVSSLVTEPANSIIHQSFHSHERVEPLNGDGFGIGWYVAEDEKPAVFKEISPAWNSLNLAHLARVTRTRCLLAHVRAATPGLPVTQLNCHPFSHGRLAFMHNGTVGGFREIRRSLQSRLSQTAYDAVQGSTDSELVFGLAIDAHAVADDAEPLERLARAMERAIARTEEVRAGHDVDEPSLLNLCLTDGQHAVVSRYVSDSSQPSNTLYVHQGKRYECDGGVCRMLPANKRDQAVIVCSEPLSTDDGWRAIPDNHLVLVDSNLEIRMRPIQPH